DLEEAWAGRKPLSNYLNHLLIQRSMLPAHAIKARFLENHDQERAAARFGHSEALRNWTAFAMLLEGCFFAYAGQERALERRPSIFEADPLDWEAGEPAFEALFSAAHSATRAIRAREDRFAIRELLPGLVLLERSGGERPAAALLNLAGRNGTVVLPAALKGHELLSGAPIDLEGRIAIPREPLIIETAQGP
ncbi:MAG: alpha-amylase family glycosyl hydrolase, partial [Spirochaetota bacterium]